MFKGSIPAGVGKSFDCFIESTFFPVNSTFRTAPLPHLDSYLFQTNPSAEVVNAVDFGSGGWCFQSKSGQKSEKLSRSIKRETTFEMNIQIC